MAEAGGRPKVVIHIGRNKAGSTTLQDYFIRHHDELAMAGVDYVLFGHPWHAGLLVPGTDRFEDVAAMARRNPHRTILISNEMMSMWPDNFMASAKAALSDCDVRIIVYLRRCDEWVRSSYAQVVRKGMNTLDIDAYYERFLPRASAMPNLVSWANRFGWDAITVRLLERHALVGGDLLVDFLAAIGLDYAPTPVKDSNVALHWCRREIMRAVTDRDADEEWGGAVLDEVQPLAMLMERLAADVPPIEYLAPEQRRALLDIWDADLAELRGLTGAPLAAAPAPPLRERIAAPSLALIPPDVMARFLETVRSPAFAARHPSAARRAARLDIPPYAGPPLRR